MKAKYYLLRLFYNKKERLSIKNTLSEQSVFYQRLNFKDRKVFFYRVLMFMEYTEFKAVNNFSLTDEMVVLISSGFAQVTFGLNRDYFKFFNKVMLMPSEYSYKGFEHFFKGDVNVKTRTINFSWPAVKEGFKIKEDGLNLVIHELGHCLILEQRLDKNYSKILDKKMLSDWKILADARIKELTPNNDSIFRDYGLVNLMEFFSVSLELFFERPQDFYHREKKLYIALTKVLNQELHYS